jgi:hypothetical protein
MYVVRLRSIDDILGYKAFTSILCAFPVYD